MLLLFSAPILCCLLFFDLCAVGVLQYFSVSYFVVCATVLLCQQYTQVSMILVPGAARCSSLSFL